MSELALHEVEPARRAAVAQDAVIVARRQWDRANRRPPALNPREALLALRYETTVVFIAACGLACGHEPTEVDRDRLALAAQRINSITEEFVR